MTRDSVRLFCASRRQLFAVSLCLVIAVVIVWAHHVDAAVGSVFGVATPVRQLLPLMWGVVTAMSTTSSVPMLERVAGARVIIASNLLMGAHVLVWSLMCVLVYAVYDLVTGRGIEWWVIHASLLTYLVGVGAALVSRTWLTGTLTWVLPFVVTLVMMAGYTNGSYSEPTTPTWWNIPAQPPTLATTTLTMVLLTVGVGSWFVRPQTSR